MVTMAMLIGVMCLVAMLAFSVTLMLFLHAVIFRRRGGEIQGIVTSKTNTQDIRSAIHAMSP